MQQQFDVVVIGAGLGGMLCAAQFAGKGQRVAVVERLGHTGGRFTGKIFHGAQVSTGAVHMLPFGSNGIVAAMLRELGVPHRVHDAEVFGSFLINERQIRVRSILSLARVFGPRQYVQFVRLGAMMFLREPRPDERNLSFRAWLVRQGVTAARDPELVRFFERVSHFGLSVDLDQIAYPEVCATMKNMFRYGPPGIVEGGCAAVAGALESRLRGAGVTVLLDHDVQSITSANNVVTGIWARDKHSGAETHLVAPLVISTIGPALTNTLTDGHILEESAAPPAATGLKTHVLSRRSLIDHQGILYCLDTERIAGIVQPSNSDPRLAPPGEHLIITHQLWRPERESIAEARGHALADLERILGPQQTNGWRVLTMSQYHDAWPVNRAVQGADAIPRTDVVGLFLVGDAVKPSGYLMVEGVAQSVNLLMDQVEGAMPATPSHVASKPPARRALAWLVAPPGPRGDSRRSLHGIQ